MSNACSDPLTLTFFWLKPENISAHCDWALSSVVTATTGVTWLGYAYVFLLTNLLELPFYAYVLHKQGIRRTLLGLFGGNTLTHPLVFFAFPFLFSRRGSSYATFLSVAEAFAVIAEFVFIYRVFKTPRRSTFVLILLANIFSWWIGVCLT